MAKPREEEKKFEKFDGSGSKPIEKLRVTAGGEPTLKQQERQEWKDKRGTVPIKSVQTKPSFPNQEKQMLVARLEELEQTLFAAQRENSHLKARVQKEQLIRESMKELLFGEDTKGYALDDTLMTNLLDILCMACDNLDSLKTLVSNGFWQQVRSLQKNFGRCINLQHSFCVG